MKKKILFIFTIIFISIFFVSFARATILANDVEVAENTELTYYLRVTYDGKDYTGLESSDTNISGIVCGYIDVEDKLPEGLEFLGFVETEDGSIGAVSRADKSPCSGYVVDGVNGLHYDPETRLVTFKVNELQAGCELTVGIRTQTPYINDPDTPELETRRDFYNYATATEESQSIISNVVHAWMGRVTVNVYQVKYEYEGSVPEGATALPAIGNYMGGATVGVAKDPIVQGYTFSGWTSSDVTISDGKFIMPVEDIVLKGSFTKIPDEENPMYTVSYQMANDLVPEGYILPTTKYYYPGSTVEVDALRKGTVLNGYRFKGWNVDETTFQMPDNNVVITGEWELVTYKVEYRFMGNILPDNSESLLPKIEYYAPGEIVSLASLASNTVGNYSFLGWYKQDNFIMPADDVIVYGEWKVQLAPFSPTITKRVVDRKDYFRFGDVVEYEITVKNTADHVITDVFVKENNEKAEFINDPTATNDTHTYLLETPRIAHIEHMEPGQTVVIYAKYIASPADGGTVKNTVEIVGALADGHELDTTVEYKASDTFIIDSELNICNTVTDGLNNRTLQYHITGIDYDSWLVLEENTCKKVYLTPGNYNVLEVVPQDYDLDEVFGNITANNTGFKVGLGNIYAITFEHSYNKKGFYHSFGRVVNIIKNSITTEGGDTA